MDGAWIAKLVQRLHTGLTVQGPNPCDLLTAPARGPTQSPVQWVPGLFHSGKAAGAWR